MRRPIAISGGGQFGDFDHSKDRLDARFRGHDGSFHVALKGHEKAVIPGPLCRRTAKDSQDSASKMSNLQSIDFTPNQLPFSG